MPRKGRGSKHIKAFCRSVAEGHTECGAPATHWWKTHYGDIFLYSTQFGEPKTPYFRCAAHPASSPQMESYKIVPIAEYAVWKAEQAKKKGVKLGLG